MTDRTHWQELATFARSRRHELRLNQDELARVADISRATYAKIEQAVSGGYSGRTLTRIEQALGWAPGSIDRILSSGRPPTMAPHAGWRSDEESSRRIHQQPPQSVLDAIAECRGESPAPRSPDSLNTVISALGVTMDLGSQDYVTDMLIIGRVMNVETGAHRFSLGSSLGTDWMTQYGLAGVAKKLLEGADFEDVA